MLTLVYVTNWSLRPPCDVVCLRDFLINAPANQKPQTHQQNGTHLQNGTFLQNGIHLQNGTHLQNGEEHPCQDRKEYAVLDDGAVEVRVKQDEREE